MLQAGHKVCVAEQEEQLREGAKLLERVVTRVYTPGSLYEESLIGTDEIAGLAAICVKAEGVGIAILDASTGHVWTMEHSGDERWDRLLDDLLRSSPREVVFSPRDAEREEVRKVISQLDGVTLSQHNSSRRKGESALKNVLEVADLGHIDLGDSPLGHGCCWIGCRLPCSHARRRFSRCERSRDYAPRWKHGARPDHTYEISNLLKL